MLVNSLLLLKGIMATVAFIAALGAFLTMMQIRGKIPAIFPLKTLKLRRWHVISGRVSLVFSIFLALIGTSLALYLLPPQSLRPWLHVTSGVLVITWFSIKVAVIRRKIPLGLKNLLPIGAILFLLHVALFLTATVWAYYFVITGVI
jgi:hypothetical protein